MTPDQLGYVKCDICKCWRKPGDLHEIWTAGSSVMRAIVMTVCRYSRQCDEVRYPTPYGIET